MKFSVLFYFSVLISTDLWACVDFPLKFKSVAIEDVRGSKYGVLPSINWNVSDVNGRVCVEGREGGQSSFPEGLKSLVFWFRLEQVVYWHKTEEGWIVTEQAGGYPSRTWWLSSDGSSMQYIGAYKLYAYKAIDESIYALPRLPGDAVVDGVVRLEKNSVGKWGVNRVAQFIEFPMREIKSNENSIYFLAGNSIYIFTPDKGVELFKRIASMPKALPSSAIKIGDVFWFGGAGFVFSVDLKNETYQYYINQQ